MRKAQLPQPADQGEIISFLSGAQPLLRVLARIRCPCLPASVASGHLKVCVCVWGGIVCGGINSATVGLKSLESEFQNHRRMK